MSATLEGFLGRLAADPGLAADLAALCGHGGRLEGTESCARAFAWTAGRLTDLGAGPPREESVPYAGWTLEKARLTLPTTGERLPCASLVGSVPTPAEGLELEVLDLGRGGPAEVEAAGAAVRGRAVLLRHEYPFARDTIHRRVKLRAAAEAGAAAALMVQPERGVGPVSGGANAAPMPAFGIGVEVAERIVAAGRVRLRLLAHHHPATAPTLVLDLPGAGPARVVVSAHLDGHPLGESAMDNATGVVAALALARAALPLLPGLPRGLTVCVFGAEEWSLSGSRAWLARRPEAERAAMAFNLNLDSIAGAPHLTALTSGFPALGPFVRAATAAVGLEVAVHPPLMVNSDHANFAAAGVPALRLLAGFDAPESALRLLLTGADTRARVAAGELKAATLTAGAILWRALTAPEAELAALRDADAVAAARAATGQLSPLPVAGPQG